MSDPIEEAMKAAAVSGPIAGGGPGRTDTVDTNVAGETFIIPADIVSAVGDGNTDHGFSVLSSMFPAPSENHAPATGKVPVKLANGEYAVSPEYVFKLGKGNPKKGHALLHQFVNKVRADHIKTLKKLPQPVRG